jgi:hypothetical protein
VTLARSADYGELIEKTGSVAVWSTPEALGELLADTFEQTARLGLQL